MVLLQLPPMAVLQLMMLARQMPRPRTSVALAVLLPPPGLLAMYLMT